ncbi:MAG: hypothetical protein WCE69_16055 [Aestuariivirga sp.]
MKYTEKDLKTAHEILGSPEKEIILGGPHQQMAEQVVKAVAEGIALGRNQGLELAASSIEKELPSLAGRIRQISC